MRSEDLPTLAGRSERQVELVCGLLDHLRAERQLTRARLSSGADQAHLGELRNGTTTRAGSLRGLNAACRRVGAYLPTGRA